MAPGPDYLRPSCSIVVCLMAIVGSAHLAAGASLEITLVPEMEKPEAILYQPRSEIDITLDDLAVVRGVETLRVLVRGRWQEIRAVDLVELSRFQRDATEGWSLPEEPGPLEAKVMARDAETGYLFLELRGPRLPARYDIVFRFLTVYARYDDETEAIDRLIVTIRGWVEE